MKFLGSPALASGSQYEFGSYCLDVSGGTLFRDGKLVPLSPKSTELLVALVEAAGRVLTREQLLLQVWPGIVIEEGSLSSLISTLRKSLGTAPNGQEFIETLPKRGYRSADDVKRARLNVPGGGMDTAMLVVLPFENLTVGDRYDYFSDGLTEEMIAELACLSPETSRRGRPNLGDAVQS